MKTLQCMMTAAVLTAVLGSASAYAQTGPSWNRKVDSIALLPTPGAPSGMYDVHVAWSTWNDIGVVNLNADLEISINGSLVDTIPEDLTIDGGIACGCTAGDGDDCSGCAGSSSCFVGVSGCGCACGNLINSQSGPHFLSAGDSISVILVAARGGVLDPDMSDDGRTTAFGGDPIVWHRRLDSVDLEPSPGGPGLYDVHVDWTSASAGIDYPIDLSADLEVSVNGAPAASLRVNRNHQPNPTVICFHPNPQDDDDCGGTFCGEADIDDVVAFPMGCHLFVPVEAQQLCWCLAASESVIPAVFAEPGDIITVILRPVPGALPELPGFPDDDEGEAVVECAPIRSVQSCRDHGQAGTLCLDMSANGSVEPRQGGIQQLEIELANPALFGGGVTVGCATAGDVSNQVSSTSTLGSIITVDFAPGLPDNDACTVTLDCGASFCVRGIEGDVDRNGVVSTGDASQIKPHFGQDPAAVGGQFDFDANGIISTGDASQVKPLFGATAPLCS